MNFEEVIFKRKKPDYQKLISYGFKRQEDSYIYKKKILDDSFEITIVQNKNKIKGKIIDLSFNEEYTNYRSESQTGSFVGQIREEFINLLKDISDKCYIERPFIKEQTNRISDLIYNKYQKKPIFKWKNNNAAVFENNDKWFAIIMNIDKSKLTNSKGEVEIINVKLDKNKITSLLNKKGFYKAYHMNKKSWITIPLDDELADSEIINLIEESYSYTIEIKKSNEWVMPLNPKYFDI